MIYRYIYIYVYSHRWKTDPVPEALTKAPAPRSKDGLRVVVAKVGAIVGGEPLATRVHWSSCFQRCLGNIAARMLRAQQKSSKSRGSGVSTHTQYHSRKETNAAHILAYSSVQSWSAIPHIHVRAHVRITTPSGVPIASCQLLVLL